MEATIVSNKRVRVLGGSLTAVESGESATVSTEPIVVGRNPSCHLTVEDSRVSAAHAELVATENGVRLRDLSSRNGTWLGDSRVTEVFLTAETDVWVGPTELRFIPSKARRVALPQRERFGGLYGTSGAMRTMFDRLDKVAATELGVLVLGETGTGKELIATAIHKASKRSKRPLVVVDCGAISSSLAEASLFGHERGAFTGAVSRRDSPFVEADGGTVFLDELGELPIEVQPKLLRALAERRIKPVGGSKYVDVDIRVIAATRRDLRRAVNEGAFRSDLYFRVAQICIDVAPLRQRVEDIPGLVRHMLRQLGEKRPDRRLKNDSLERLMRHDWPGNVRELKNAVSAAHGMAGEGDPIDVAAYVGQLSAGPVAPIARGSALGHFRDARKAFEVEYFTRLAKQAEGNVSEMGRLSGLERAHVRRYLKRHGVDR